MSIATSLNFPWAPADLVRRFRARFGRPLTFRVAEAAIRKPKPR
jgi:hypothetical protein